MTTSNFFINNILSPLTEFGGVYNTTSIKTADFKDYPCYLVCNLSPAGTLGSHWVGLALFKNHIFYFDSLGKKCHNKHIQSFLLTKGYRSYKYLNKPIQNFFSRHCGYFVMSFFIYLSRGFTPKDYLDRFENDSLENDKTVVKDVLKF